jgi:hypothetical protein
VCVDRAIRIVDPKADPASIKPVNKRHRSPTRACFGMATLAGVFSACCGTLRGQ